MLSRALKGESRITIGAVLYRHLISVNGELLTMVTPCLSIYVLLFKMKKKLMGMGPEPYHYKQIMFGLTIAAAVIIEN